MKHNPTGVSNQFTAYLFFSLQGFNVHGYIFFHHSYNGSLYVDSGIPTFVSLQRGCDQVQGYSRTTNVGLETTIRPRISEKNDSTNLSMDGCTGPAERTN